MVNYDDVYAEVAKLGIHSNSARYRTCSLLTRLILLSINNPDLGINDRLAVAEASMGDMCVSSEKAREQLEAKLHDSDIPESLYRGDVIENTISYIIEKLK